MFSRFEVHWKDGEREPQVPFNREYPWGIDVKACDGCKVELPWPAPRCGLWFVKCTYCKSSMVITAAGRVDDPRSVVLKCRLEDIREKTKKRVRGLGRGW
jgi:hypothetical protein